MLAPRFSPRYSRRVTPPFSSNRTSVVRRNPWYMGLASAPLGIAVLYLLTALVTGTPQILIFLPHLSIFSIALLVYVWRKNPSPRDIPARIDVDAQGVSKDGVLIVPRAKVREAFVMPRADGALIVRVRRKGRRPAVDLRVPDREEGRALLRSLGFDASQTAADFRLPSRVVGDPRLRGRMVLGFFGFMVTIMGLFALLAALKLFVLLPVAGLLYVLGIGTFVTLMAIVRSRLRVGADGIHHGWLRWKRFIGYADMTLVRQYEDNGWGKNRMLGIEITLKSGEVVRIPVQPKQSGIRDDVATIEERIAEAVDTWRRGEGVTNAALVGRAGRDTTAWLRSLRSIGAGANADARTAPVLPEKLWRIVEDPSAPPEARAGAAVALGATIDDEGRTRLRAAADVTAAPKLRVVIEAAAKDTPEDELAAALAEVESAEPTQRAAG